MSTADVLETVRNSPPAVKAEVLAELLREAFVGTAGGPVPVHDGCGGVLGYILKPPPAGPYTPPKLSPEELAELQRRYDTKHLAVPLDEFMKRLDLEIESRLAARPQPAAEPATAGGQ